MFARLSLVVVACLATLGCATTAQNTLAQAKRDALRIDKITLAFAPDASLSWFDAATEYNQRGGAPDGLRAFMEQKASARLKPALESKIIPAFRGSDPAELTIVRRLDIPPGIERILIGGDHILDADLRLADAKTGQVLIEVKEFSGMSKGGQGPIQVMVEQFFPDPIDRVAAAFSSAIASWLKTGSAFITG